MLAILPKPLHTNVYLEKATSIVAQSRQTTEGFNLQVSSLLVSSRELNISKPVQLCPVSYTRPDVVMVGKQDSRPLVFPPMGSCYPAGNGHYLTASPAYAKY